jgi:metal-dependent HD superfamily phosphatase/phosphodiesterase
MGGCVLPYVIKLPYHHNAKLKLLVDEVNRDEKLQAYWKCVNVAAIDRMGFSDHGPIHVKIVANSALKLLRILVESGVTPNIVKDYGMTNEDAEVVVFLAAVMHDLGMAVVRERHEEYSVLLALSFLQKYLEPVYPKDLTLEAGVVRVADALDMEKGRARIPFEAGKINIHSISALSIEKVEIRKGTEKPVTIKIKMSNSAGVFQVDDLLKGKIQGSGLEKYIHVVAEITGERERKIIERFEI